MPCHIVKLSGKFGLSMASKLTSAKETPPPTTTGLAGLLGSVISVGRDILARRRHAAAQAPSGDLLAKCRQLIHHRGEASGLALAAEVIADYQALDAANQIRFLRRLAVLSIPILRASLPLQMLTRQTLPLSS